MEESDGGDIGMKGLIDFSSENDSLIVSASSSTFNCGQSSETQDESKSFELGDVDANKVMDRAHTSGQSEQLPQLIEMPEPERTRKNGKCNLRKSLAWDSAFFTSSGVLDPEELSTMIEGAEKGKKHALPGIEEDIRRSTDSISTLESDNLTLETLETELFEGIRASIQKSSNASKMANSISKPASGETDTQALSSSKKVHLTSQNKFQLKPKTASKMITTGMQRSGKMIKQGSNPQVPQSGVKIGDSVSSLSRIPKVTSRTNQPTPLPTVATKRTSLGANRAKIESDIATSAAGGSKGTQVSKVTALSGARRAVPKPAPSSKSSSLASAATKPETRRSSSSCDSSGTASSGNIGKSPLTSARRKIDSRPNNPHSSGPIPKTSPKIALRNKIPSEKPGISAYLMSSNLSSSISPASSISEWSSESSSSTSTVNQRPKSRASLDTSSCRSIDSDAAAAAALGLNMHSNDQTSYGNKNQATGLPSQNIKKASTQTGSLSRPPFMKPSGLRMPSPKIGFFDGAKSVVRTPNGGMQSQSRLPTGLPKIGVGISSPIGSSNKTKVGKLPPAITVSPIGNIKPNTQNTASPRPFREPLSASMKVSREAKSYPIISTEVQTETGGVSYLKAEDVGALRPHRDQLVTDPGLVAEKNGNLDVLKNKLSLNMQGPADLKEIKIAPTEGNICDSNLDSCLEYITRSQGVDEDAIHGQHLLKNNLLGSTNVKENGHFGDQVDGLSRNMGPMASQLENQKELVVTMTSDCGASEICSEGHIVQSQKEESLSNLFTANTRTPFAVKNSLSNSEGVDFSTESSIDEVEKTATLLPSEIGQQENS